MSDVKFDNLVTLYRAANFTAGRKATLEIANQVICDALNACLDNLHEYAVTIVENRRAVAVDNTVHVEFGEPRLGLGLLADDMSGLLKSPKNRVREPKNYFLIDSKFAKSDANIPLDVQRYHRVLKLIDLFKTAAAYLDADEGTLVFVHGGKFELPIRYTLKDFDVIDESAIDKLLTFVGEDAFNEKKLGILEGAIREASASYADTDRFQGLLANLPELVEKASHGYRVFISEFSYDKIRDSLEAAKIEYAAKIHKAFTDIQAQILSIPVATVVVATQMKKATDFGSEFWVNTAVLVGCWVFVLLVGFLVRNQMHTLSVLDDEIKRQKKQTEKNYKDIADQFSNVFIFLQARLHWQRCALKAVVGVLVVGIVLTHIVFFELTTFESESRSSGLHSDGGAQKESKDKSPVRISGTSERSAPVAGVAPSPAASAPAAATSASSAFPSTSTPVTGSAPTAVGRAKGK